VLLFPITLKRKRWPTRGRYFQAQRLADSGDLEEVCRVKTPMLLARRLGVWTTYGATFTRPRRSAAARQVEGDAWKRLAHRSERLGSSSALPTYFASSSLGA
jgi:hypothetical protein